MSRCSGSPSGVILCLMAAVTLGSVLMTSRIAEGQDFTNTRELIDRLDRDGDGAISLSEIPQRMQRLRNAFDIVDANADGRVTASELDAMKSRRQPAATASSPPPESRPSNAGPATIPTPTVGHGAQAIRARLQQAIANQELPGAVVLFVHNGAVVFEEAHGFADRERRRPQRTDDLFNLGSTSKPLAMTAVMTQVADGKFSLDDSVTRWYPQYADKTLANGARATRAPTVREMLSHISGTFGVKCGDRRDLALLYKFGRTLKESADAIADRPLVNQPGEQFCYGGPAMQVMGRTVEMIAGKDFDTVTKERVFTPLGMKDTFYRTSQDLGDRIAVIYEKNAGGLQRSARTRNPRADPFILVPGGLFSTARDLARFVQAHLQGGVLDGQRVLPEGLVLEMRRNQIGNKKTNFGDPSIGDRNSAALGEIEGYGLGWILDEVSAGRARVFSHGGAWGTYIWGDVEAQLGAVLLTQTRLANATPAWNDILRIARATWTAGGARRQEAEAWKPDVKRIGATGIQYIDPEILSSEGLMAFQDQAGGVWVGRLDPVSGLFRSADGKDILMSSGALNLRETYNEPEFGLDANGWSVFFTKIHDGVPQLWRSRLSGGKPVAQPVTTDRQRRQSILASKNARAATTRLLYLQGKLGNGRFFWLDEDKPALETAVVRLKEVDSPRWIDDTLQFVFAESDGADASQIRLVDTATSRARTITDDVGVKAFAYGWKAPEYSGEILVLALVDYKTVGVWRDTGKEYWERIATLTPPPGSRYRNFGSPEPLVAQGRSYVSLVLKDENTRGRFRDSEVWILGIDADPARNFARRVDDGRSPVMRSDPETFEGGNEIFIYYNAFDRDNGFEIYRARTGLGTR